MDVTDAVSVSWNKAKRNVEEVNALLPGKVVLRRLKLLFAYEGLKRRVYSITADCLTVAPKRCVIRTNPRR